MTIDDKTTTTARKKAAAKRSKEKAKADAKRKKDNAQQKAKRAKAKLKAEPKPKSQITPNKPPRKRRSIYPHASPEAVEKRAQALIDKANASPLAGYVSKLPPSNSKGGNFWRRRSTQVISGSKGGSTPFFETPEELLVQAEDYFQWTVDHPLLEMCSTTIKGFYTAMQIPKMRAMSIKDLCLHLEIAKSTWVSYRNREEFKYVCERIEDVIYTQKFQGAAAGMLNSNLISSDLGIKDEVDPFLDGEPIKRITRTIIDATKPNT